MLVGLVAIVHHANAVIGVSKICSACVVMCVFLKDEKQDPLLCETLGIRETEREGHDALTRQQPLMGKSWPTRGILVSSRL
jgi:hypothetical protein